MTRLAVLVATAGGLGHAPVAPGTFGSAAGVAIYLLMAKSPVAWQVAVALVVVVVGTWASSQAAHFYSRDDPSQVVVDEVAGQLVTLIFTGVGLAGAAVGFLVFRVLDIVKPWPANRFESLHGGVGIMADDVMAALYGNIIMQVLVRGLPVWL